MNQFGLIAIGLLLGILVAILALSVAALAYLVWQVRRDLQSQRQQLLAALTHSIQSVTQLQSSVTSALSSLDADRLHAASQSAQLATKKLIAIVQSMAKMVYADGSGAGLLDPNDQDYTPGMDPLVNAGMAGIAGTYAPPLTEDAIERETAAGITSMDRIAIREARREGRRQQQQELARMAAERADAAQQQASAVLDPEQATLLQRTRDELLRMGINPLTVVPNAQLSDRATRSRDVGLPDLDSAFGNQPSTFTEGE